MISYQLKEIGKLKSMMKTLHTLKEIKPLKSQRRIFTAQAGFTLIEVMVTVFILSIGILGAAGMQAVSVRESQNTYYRTQADMLASDIVDRMRANRTDARDEGTSAYTEAGVGNDCSTECDADDMAAADVFEWQASITRSSLPSVQGSILRSSMVVDASGATVGAVYIVTVMWDEDRSGSTGTNCNPSDEDDLSCSRIIVQI